MDVFNLEQKIAQFQARVRGHLVRKEVRHARGDFEEIVSEIDGSLKHLRWNESVISTPDFTDTTIPYLRLCSSTWRPPDPKGDVGISSKSSGASLEERRDLLVLSEKMEAERDDSQSGNRERQRPVTGMNTSSTRSLSGLHWKKTGEQHCWAEDGTCTPEALRLHRNTLSMELLWIQQAIDSRKKYLSLKDSLGVS